MVGGIVLRPYVPHGTKKIGEGEVKLNGYVPLNNLIPNFVAMSIISCISSVDSSPNLLFFLHFFCRRNLASREKFYTERHLPNPFSNKVKVRNNG